MNIGAPWPDLAEAESRVLAMQTKLHHRATNEPGRQFDDLWNLVYDPAFLVVAWDRVRGNAGARSAGVDGIAPRSIGAIGSGAGAPGAFLTGLRDDLKARRFVPTPVREKMIPKPGGKRRRLGIPTAADRVVQAALKLVREPLFEADFKLCSYGFRPKRRAQDAVAEIHYLGVPARNYEWVFEADIAACFDEIDHTALVGRVRRRVGDKRVLRLVQAFLRAGILSEAGVSRETITGTPQGGILSPLLAGGPPGDRPVRAGRALHHQMGSARAGMDAQKAPACRCSGHAARPLRGRLRGHGRRATRRRRSALGRGQRGPRADGPAPVGREDEGLPP